MTAQDDQLMLGTLAGGERYASIRAPCAQQEELARELKARRVTAWGALFDEQFDHIYRYALARLRSREAAEDVAAATFHRALASIDSYSYRGPSPLAWLYGIARNVVKETCRGDLRHNGAAFAKHMLGSANAGRLSGGRPSNEVDETDGLVSHIDLGRAMRRLTRAQREVVALRFFAGLSAGETGEAMGRPETAVYALQARAIVALRRQLA